MIYVSLYMIILDGPRSNMVYSCSLVSSFSNHVRLFFSNMVRFRLLCCMCDSLGDDGSFANYVRRFSFLT